MHPSSTEIIGLYQRHALIWDQERGRSLFERAWLDRFREAMRPWGSVLDIGCGAGEPIAHYLMSQDHAVTGVDSSAALIALAAQRFPDHTWKTGDMRQLDLGRTFDGILAGDSFFHLAHADQRAMFPVFKAHATSGTALMFTSGPAHGEAIGSYQGETLYHASLAPEAYIALLADNGFEVLAHAAEDASCGGHTVWLARAT